MREKSKIKVSKTLVPFYRTKMLLKVINKKKTRNSRKNGFVYNFRNQRRFLIEYTQEKHFEV